MHSPTLFSHASPTLLNTPPILPILLTYFPHSRQTLIKTLPHYSTTFPPVTTYFQCIPPHSTALPPHISLSPLFSHVSLTFPLYSSHMSHTSGTVSKHLTSTSRYTPPQSHCISSSYHTLLMHSSTLPEPSPTLLPHFSLSPHIYLTRFPHTSLVLLYTPITRPYSQHSSQTLLETLPTIPLHSPKY